MYEQISFDLSYGVLTYLKPDRNSDGHWLIRTRYDSRVTNVSSYEFIWPSDRLGKNDRTAPQSGSFQGCSWCYLGYSHTVDACEESRTVCKAWSCAGSPHRKHDGVSA